MHKTTPIHAARPLNLVLARTVTGATTFIVTRRPDEQLGHLGTLLEIDQRHVVQTEHADVIAQKIRQDLEEKRLSAQEGAWFGVDWETALALVEDFDPATGQRIRLGDINVGSEVWAKITTAEDGAAKARKCIVVGIVGRLYLLELIEPVGELRRIMMPRELIKPHLRLAALAEAA